MMTAFMRSLCLFLVLSITALIAACGGGESEKSRRTSLSSVSDTEPVALDASIKSLVKVDELRISRTVFDYKFRIVLEPGSVDAKNVTVSVVAAGSGTTIVEGTILVGEVSA
jgi:hypothetical protein